MGPRKPPCAESIRARLRAIHPSEKALKREGKKAARDKFGAVKDSFPGADAPLAVVQIDHTKLDIIVLDEDMRLPMGCLPPLPSQDRYGSTSALRHQGHSCWPKQRFPPCRPAGGSHGSLVRPSSCANPVPAQRSNVAWARASVTARAVGQPMEQMDVSVAIQVARVAIAARLEDAMEFTWPQSVGRCRPGKPRRHGLVRQLRAPRPKVIAAHSHLGRCSGLGSGLISPYPQAG